MGQEGGSLDAKLAPEDFVADITFAGRALLSQPLVALVPVLFWSFPVVAVWLTEGQTNGWVVLVILGISLFSSGWAGAERIFFLRRLDKMPITVRELFGFVTPFMGRFLALGLLLGAGYMALLLPTLLMLGPAYGYLGSRSHVPMAILAGVADFALTFVPSALTFSTRSVWRALRIGFAMIRRTWPRCGLYVLCPPLALNFLNVIIPARLVLVRLVFTIVLTVIALLAKGATAAFYLRERPTYGPRGAAEVKEADEALDAVVRG